MSTLARSILVHLDSSPHGAARLRLAAELAQAFDAHCHALPCILSAYERYPYAMDFTGAALSSLQTLDREALDRARTTFDIVAADSDRISWLSPRGSTPWAFAQCALFHDLVVLGQRDPSDPQVDEVSAGFASAVMIASGKPTLMVPWAGRFDILGRRVLVAWRPTRECARAVSAAIPWMRLARGVDLVSYSDAALQELAPLKEYLQQHGIDAVVHDGGREHGDAPERLLSLAADLGSGLLVMGCWGHSRVHEWATGGMTRSVLASMTLPVLMVH
ncbi:nucleotide-binding universal stress UspA family protein [Pseudacidovorax intermedius]|uniref:Nucleotide-binding universal stress UspA family protein n=2 Tax=Pseudacidovorax intermedius TaxID=433924 RepID=A0A370FHE4_9BURK|nr:nucleotide-binding universal stress UspA family protein [Pseudacidovorax intermedius]